MKSICRHQTFTGLPKHFPKKLNQAPCTIFYTEKMTNFPKVTTSDTNSLQPGKLIHVNLSFYNVTSIFGFTSIFTVFCSKTGILWMFPTASKQAPVRIILFILIKLNNKQHPYKFVRVDEYGSLENSTDVTNLLFD